MRGEAWEYAAVFVGSLLCSLVLTPLVLRLAIRRQILDHPGDHKVHESPVPYLGGLAMVGALSAAVLAASLLSPPESGMTELVTVMGIAIALSVVGLVDDLRNLGPWVRLAAEIGAGFGVWQAGAGVELFGNGAVDCIVTIVWVVGMTNAFNLLDNMDGLSAGIAVIAAGSFFVIAEVNGQFLVAALCAALAGGAVGFLRHNFHPARIYMGDAGSLYLGFVLAYLGLKLRFDAPDDVTFLVPILVLAVPILDTTLVTVCRLLNGRSPFQGGQDHISHRLVRVGLPIRAAVGVLYGAAISLGVVALVVSRGDRTTAYLLAGLALAQGLVVGVLLARVPVYRTVAAPVPAPAPGATAAGDAGPAPENAVATVFGPVRSSRRAAG